MYTLMAELDDPLMFTHLWPSSAFTMSPTASPVKLTSLPFRARLADTRTPTRVSMTTLSSSVREFPSLSRDSKRSESEPISTVPPFTPDPSCGTASAGMARHESTTMNVMKKMDVGRRITSSFSPTSSACAEA